jgi:hypothetical protein
MGYVAKWGYKHPPPPANGDFTATTTKTVQIYPDMSQFRESRNLTPKQVFQVFFDPNFRPVPRFHGTRHQNTPFVMYYTIFS